ncbi:MAG TPA: asparagine synthase (glutamine-hydrolyzing) [Candidatus Omnitrophota bacterium]|nr:asparagine synthase (glutamine-hydrolyzing) [Candidatus Omnitrophota bacterium]
MCGITGKLYFDRNKRIEPGLIEAMNRALIHRGPDDEGVYEDYNFAFGIRRLSIIDIEGGHQPIFNEDHTKSIVFNGEIYNYQQLRSDLKSRGHRFCTNSDTEVVLHAYEEFGNDCVNKLNGMFAFAIWDSGNQRLVLARDRLGIKPLYYYLDNEKLLFASEIKAIIEDRSVERKVDPEALDLYLSFNYVPAPFSMFQNIRKLSAGTILLCEDGKSIVKQYWDVDFSREPAHKSLGEYEEEFRYLLNDAVKLQMLSDVPVGAFLSGGIDSSSVVANMSLLSDQPVQTFTIGFEGGGYHDETRFAKMVADQYKSRHHVFHVDADVFDLMDEYVHFFDEPFADYAAFPTYVLAKHARERVKVVLTGDGCDEIFAGYERYGSESMAQGYKMVPPFIRERVLLPMFHLGKRMSVRSRGLYNFFHGAEKKTRLMSLSDDDRYVEGLYSFSYDQKKDLFSRQGILKEDFSLQAHKAYLKDKDDFDFLSRRLYLDIKTSLVEDMLTKLDRVSMAVSLEARVPFLDHRLVEFSARLPSQLKTGVFRPKKFVRGAVKGLLPAEIIDRPKHGLSSPIDAWFRRDLKGLLQGTLTKEALGRSGFFRNEFIAQMMNAHLNGTANHGKELFMVMVFQLWHDKYMR